MHRAPASVVAEVRELGSEGLSLPADAMVREFWAMRAVVPSDGCFG